MGNERHYYISQIANGSAGIFLEKPDWKITDQQFDLERVKTQVYEKAKHILSLLYSEKISLQKLNVTDIRHLLTEEVSGSDVLPRELVSKLEEVKSEFEENLSKNVYGKKQHAYKIPNAEELQKLLIIPKNYNTRDHACRIYLRVCLRVLFEQFFTDPELYHKLVDKIIDHVQDEVNKNKKDTAEKLPELKRIFYTVNRREFGQKFLDAPQDLKKLKANFSYEIPSQDLRTLFVDFQRMMSRLQELETAASD